jgi:hypothetical protein
MLPVIPLFCDLLNHIVWAICVEPENLNGMRTPHLHLQPTTDRRELQVFLGRSNLCDDAKSDLAHMRAIPSRFNSPDRTWDHGGMPSVELGASQETFGVAHIPVYRQPP